MRVIVAIVAMALFAIVLIIRNDIGRPAPYLIKGERDAQLERNEAPSAQLFRRSTVHLDKDTDGGGDQ